MNIIQRLLYGANKHVDCANCGFEFDMTPDRYKATMSDYRFCSEACERDYGVPRKPDFGDDEICWGEFA